MVVEVSRPSCPPNHSHTASLVMPTKTQQLARCLPSGWWLISIHSKKYSMQTSLAIFTAWHQIDWFSVTLCPDVKSKNSVSLSLRSVTRLVENDYRLWWLVNSQSLVVFRRSLEASLGLIIITIRTHGWPVFYFLSNCVVSRRTSHGQTPTENYWFWSKTAEPTART